MTVVGWVIERVHCGPAADNLPLTSSLLFNKLFFISFTQTLVFHRGDSREETTILVFVFVVEETRGRMATGGQVPLAAEHTGGCGIEETCLKTKHT